MVLPSRDTLLASGLLLLLLAVTVLAALAEGREEAAMPDLASFSNGPSGARALRLWLDEEGYSTDDSSEAVFALPGEATLALILEPQLPGITEDEWPALDAWVEAGGTLVLLGEGFGAALSLGHYEVEISYTSPQAEPSFAAPLLASPPFVPSALRPRATLQTARADAVTLLAAGEEALLVAFTQGNGLVILGTVTYPLTNAGLKDGDNPSFALNLATLAGDDGLIWFDEWHHGRRGEAALVGPDQWLRQTPAGRALLYSAAVIFLGIVLAGRRFGRPVPLVRPGRRRAPLEHIIALANLSRRAGHRQAVLEQYHSELKRQLGRRYRISPALPDEEYVAQMARFRPDLDTAAFGRLLGRLRSPGVSEGEMVTLARQAAEWLQS
jgi:hypothetical protein